MRLMRVENTSNLMRMAVFLVGLLMVLAACGGSTTAESGDVADAATTGDGGQDIDRGQPGSSGSSSGGGDGAATATSGASAMLAVGTETYAFAGNQWTYCEIGGLFPANAEFQTEQDKRAGNWVQFVDRGDGGVNFSAVLEGEEYSGTGSGEADEITSTGLTYTGRLNRGGEVLEAWLEVSCG